MKRSIACILVLALLLCLAGCDIGGQAASKQQLSDFYNKVKESQALLDAVADTIYSNWHSAIYEDEFGEDINMAILAAQLDHADDLTKIEALDKEISELFKEVKNHEETGALVKDVMSAYSDYYEFVVNVSGSFNSYSADKESLKKELASLLKDLSYEL